MSNRCMAVNHVQVLVMAGVREIAMDRVLTRVVVLAASNLLSIDG